ncbi:MAG: PLP-dependent transferase, partial [Gemmataceae bacterium]
MIGKEKPFPEDAYPLEMGQSGGETHDLHRREFFHGVVLAGGVGANYAFAGKAEGPASSISKVNADPAYRSNTGRDFTTQAIHHGESAGYQVTPISQDKAAPGYQRPGNLGNPTVASLLRKVMELEGAPSAVGAPCGMSAIAQTYQALLLPGDRVITHRCNYDWVMTLFRNHLPSWGVKVDFVDLSKPDNLVAALKDRPAKVVHWEPYVNPTMEVLDSQSLARIARDAGAITVVDNTWLSPYLFQAH